MREGNRSMIEPTPTRPSRVSDEEIARRAWEVLGQVYDPEIGIDLVNLGLVYELSVSDGAVRVRMSLTTPGCPMSDSLPDAVTRALSLIPGVREDRLDVELVWEPRWDPTFMSELARRELGWP